MEKKFDEPTWKEIKAWIEAERNEALARFRNYHLPARLAQRVIRDSDKKKKTASAYPLAWQRVLTVLVVVGVCLGIYLSMKKAGTKEKNTGVVAFFQQSEKMRDLYNRRPDSTGNTLVMNTGRFRTGQGQAAHFSVLEQTIDRFFSINFKRFLEVKNG